MLTDILSLICLLTDFIVPMGKFLFQCHVHNCTIYETTGFADFLQWMMIMMLSKEQMCRCRSCPLKEQVTWAWRMMCDPGMLRTFHILILFKLYRSRGPGSELNSVVSEHTDQSSSDHPHTDLPNSDHSSVTHWLCWRTHHQHSTRHCHPLCS